jgi:hypothetical protein
LYGDLVYSQSEALLGLVLFLVLLGVGEAGYRYGRSSRSKIDDLTRGQALAIQGAILGLLGLLLGFTFAMAVSRGVAGTWWISAGQFELSPPSAASNPPDAKSTMAALPPAMPCSPTQDLPGAREPAEKCAKTAPCRGQ